jgi:2-polyprenyl-6-methoxyphenol hydroxylase-like FAD-dependent oxidoreductase
VVERAPGPRDGGQAIDLRGAARDVADRMGILPEIRRAHTGTRGMALVDAANRRLATMPADLLGDSGGAIAELEILRGDLVGILHAATRDQVEYRFDDAITGIAQGEDGLEVAFERGAPRTFDLVVGADGLHSGVRALAFGEESAFVRDLGGYVASFATATRLDLDGWELFYSVPGKTAGLYPLPEGTQAAVMFYHRTAFTRYQQKLDGYVARGHKQARSARGFLLPRSRTGIRARTQVLRMLPHLPWRGLIAGSIQRAANAITLDDYRSYQA